MSNSDSGLDAMTAKPAKTTSATPSHQNLQGWSADSSDPVALHAAIELAFNYRGDVTIVRKSSREPIEGYVFDRRGNDSATGPLLRLIPKGTEDRVTVPISDIAALRFTGKDTASGKSFESWVKKYAQKKLAGEAANIDADPSEDGG